MYVSLRLPRQGIVPCLIVACLLIAYASPLCRAQSFEPVAPASELEGVWSPFLQGGYVYQLDRDLGQGDSFSVNRFIIQSGLSYTTTDRRSVSFAFGYSFDGYAFSGFEGFGAERPWRNIHTFRIAAPVRWGFDPHLTLFVMPTLRLTAEGEGDFGRAVSGGGFVGLSYRLGEGLTIGPGLGILTQLEDNPTVFPVLILNWQVTSRLNVGTGPGLGATLGPGLHLSWQATDHVILVLGGRFERRRFRLDQEGIAPNGIGDDRSFPLFGSVVYRFSQDVVVSLIGGLNLDGTLRLEDENGNPIGKASYHPAPFAGFTFRARF